MKVSWWVGAVVAIFLSLAAYSFQLPFASSLTDALALVLILVGLWTIVAAFLVVETKDRTYYSIWGVIITVLSLFAFVSPSYAIGFLLVAVVVLILAMVYGGRRGMVTVAGSPPAPAGDTPAANPFRA